MRKTVAWSVTWKGWSYRHRTVVGGSRTTSVEIRGLTIKSRCGIWGISVRRWGLQCWPLRTSDRFLIVAADQVNNLTDSSFCTTRNRPGTNWLLSRWSRRCSCHGARVEGTSLALDRSQSGRIRNLHKVFFITAWVSLPWTPMVIWVFSWNDWRPLAIWLNSHLIYWPWSRFEDIVDISDRVSKESSRPREKASTDWSTWSASKETSLLQTGHVQVGACSCSWRNEVASKHWLCVHTEERHGVLIRRVESGHFRDIIDDVATISASSALLDTASKYKREPRCVRMLAKDTHSLELPALVISICLPWVDEPVLPVGAGSPGWPWRSTSIQTAECQSILQLDKNIRVWEIEEFVLPLRIAYIGYCLPYLWEHTLHA